MAWHCRNIGFHSFKHSGLCGRIKKWNNQLSAWAAGLHVDCAVSLCAIQREPAEQGMGIPGGIHDADLPDAHTVCCAVTDGTV